MLTPSCPECVGIEQVGDGAGMQRPVQRIAGKAATGSEQDLPFVLDDDAVAPVFDERVQDQQAAHPHDDDDDDAAQMQALRPRYGHRSPASALAGRAATCTDSSTAVLKCCASVCMSSVLSYVRHVPAVPLLLCHAVLCHAVPCSSVYAAMLCLLGWSCAAVIQSTVRLASPCRVKTIL